VVEAALLPVVPQGLERSLVGLLVQLKAQPLAELQELVLVLLSAVLLRIFVKTKLIDLKNVKSSGSVIQLGVTPISLAERMLLVIGGLKKNLNGAKNVNRVSHFVFERQFYALYTK